MNIYKVERVDDADTGDYFEFVCLADTAAEAKRLDPQTGMFMFIDGKNNFIVRTGKPQKWTDNANNVKVTLLGTAVETTTVEYSDGIETNVILPDMPTILAASILE